MKHITYTLHTPYHSLGDEHGLHVPTWAQHRSVYRSAGRTVYLVETDHLGSARKDLRQLSRRGWDVSVEQDRGSHGARISLTQNDLARAA